MAENEPIKTTPFPASAIPPTRKPLYGQTKHVDQYGNLWVRLASGTVGVTPQTTGVDETVEGMVLAGVDPQGLVRLLRVDEAGYPLDPATAKLDAILATLDKILFVLSAGLDIEPEDALSVLTQVA